MALRGTDPESYITEYTSVYEKNLNAEDSVEGKERSIRGPARAHLRIYHYLNKCCYFLS